MSEYLPPVSPGKTVSPIGIRGALFKGRPDLRTEIRGRWATPRPSGSRTWALYGGPVSGFVLGKSARSRNRKPKESEAKSGCGRRNVGHWSSLRSLTRRELKVVLLSARGAEGSLQISPVSLAWRWWCCSLPSRQEKLQWMARLTLSSCECCANVSTAIAEQSTPPYSPRGGRRLVACSLSCDLSGERCPSSRARNLR